MCGICGFVNHRDDGLLKSMASSLVHRGPDEEGFFVDGDRAGIGIRRLKIIDLETGSQPIFNEDKSIAVVFNGEIYNYKELRAKSEELGHKFYTKTDTEVIVHAYEEYQEDCPKHFRGMFAFALWDKKKQKLLLVRDHFGIKPLFYSVVGNKIFFASEIKALLLCPEIPDELDLAALDAYFSYLYIPYPLTAYKNIKKLPPATCLTFKDGNLRINRYWQIEDFADTSGAVLEEDCIKEIGRLLQQSVREQMVSDVPLGLLLSGGMDSSTVLYYMAGASKIPVKTFTAGYGPKDMSFDETAKAKLVADHFKTEHHEIMLQPDISSVMEKLAARFDEPFADASAIPTYMVTEEARKNVTVALTGIGGDEIFAGYPRYLGARMFPAYLKLPEFFRKGMRLAAQYLPESFSARNLPGRFKRFINADAIDFMTGYESWLSYFSAQEKSRLYESGPLTAAGQGTALSGRVLSPDDVFVFDVRNYLPSDLLCLADRTSMANSVELRVPFLDVRLVEFMAKIPLANKTRGFNMKYLLKKAMAGKLPERIINAGKMGFQVPLARWYSEEIKNFAHDVLSPAALKKEGYLNPDYAATVLKEHESGIRNLGDQIYAMLMFQIWLRKQREKTALNSAVLSLTKGENPPISRHPFQTNSSQVETTLVVSPTFNKGGIKGGFKKILLINLGGLGDIVMMTPILMAIKTAYPGSEISLLIINRSIGLASKLKEISEIFSVPVTYKLPDLVGLWSLFKTLFALSKRRFDVALNLRLVSSGTGAWKMRLINAFIKSKFTIGRCLSGLKCKYDVVYEEQIVENKSEVALISRLLEHLGIETADLNLHLDVHESDRAFADSELKRLGISGKKLIGFNPGAFRPSRRWPIENWILLADKVLKAYPESVIIVSGSAEEAENYGGLLISDRVKILAGYDMGKLIALFEKMDLFITNDTGPMHMAAGVGTKVVAIFGPGDYYRYSPSVNKNKYRIVRKEIPECKVPCYKLKCENPVCLTRITPQDVLSAIKELKGSDLNI